jgi:hypothetical protein
VESSLDIDERWCTYISDMEKHPGVTACDCQHVISMFNIALDELWDFVICSHGKSIYQASALLSTRLDRQSVTGLLNGCAAGKRWTGLASASS